MRKNNVLRKYIASLLLFLLFETVAITLWKAKGNLFYLLNFSYIGGCLALGTALFTAGKRYARHFLGVLRRQQSTTQSRRYSVHCFSGAAGAAMPVGQLWCWIFCLTNSRKNRERKS